MDFSQFYKPTPKRRKQSGNYAANIHLAKDGKACVYLTVPLTEDVTDRLYWIIPIKGKDAPDQRDCLVIHNGNRYKEQWLDGRGVTFNKHHCLTNKGMTIYIWLADVPKRLRPTSKKPKIELHVTKSAGGDYLLRLPVDVQQVITYVD